MIWNEIVEWYLLIGAAIGTHVVMHGSFKVKGFPSWMPKWAVVVVAYTVLWLPALLLCDGEINWWKR